MRDILRRRRPFALSQGELWRKPCDAATLRRCATVEGLGASNTCVAAEFCFRLRRLNRTALVPPAQQQLQQQRAPSWPALPSCPGFEAHGTILETRPVSPLSPLFSNPTARKTDTGLCQALSAARRSFLKSESRDSSRPSVVQPALCAAFLRSTNWEWPSPCLPLPCPGSWQRRGHLERMASARLLQSACCGSGCGGASNSTSSSSSGRASVISASLTHGLSHRNLSSQVTLFQGDCTALNARLGFCSSSPAPRRHTHHARALSSLPAVAVSSDEEALTEGAHPSDEQCTPTSTTEALMNGNRAVHGAPAVPSGASGVECEGEAEPAADGAEVAAAAHSAISAAMAAASTNEDGSPPPEGVPGVTTTSGRRRRAARRSDLLAVPGVGPRTLLKLRASGIEEVAALTRVYRQKTTSEEGMQGMVDYLRKDVGVRKDHATLISSFAKSKVDEEGDEEGALEEGGRRNVNRLTFCVEGNISVGKSTFLRRVAGEIQKLTMASEMVRHPELQRLRQLGDSLNLHEFVEIVPEPVDKWQDVGPAHVNLLQEFYDDPKKYGYTFQNYVFVTRVMQSLSTRKGRQPLRLLERSIFSDRNVFVKAVHEAKWMDDVQLQVYDSSFDPYVKHLQGLVPDGFIYLRAMPETCHERLLRRAREEESKVSLDYLANLHEKHERWLYPLTPSYTPYPFSANSLHSVEHSLSQLQGGHPRTLTVESPWPRNLGNTPVPENLKGRVFGLGAPNVHPAIRNVPALVLDCDAHLDLNLAPGEVNWFAEDILAFFDFVKQMKEEASSLIAQPPSLLHLHHGDFKLKSQAYKPLF